MVLEENFSFGKLLKFLKKHSALNTDQQIYNLIQCHFSNFTIDKNIVLLVNGQKGSYPKLKKKCISSSH